MHNSNLLTYMRGSARQVKTDPSNRIKIAEYENVVIRAILQTIGGLRRREKFYYSEIFPAIAIRNTPRRRAETKRCVVSIGFKMYAAYMWQCAYLFLADRC